MTTEAPAILRPTTSRRAFAVLLVTALALAGALVVVMPDRVGAVTVSTEAELRAAFGNPTETQIDLANDITLGDDCNAAGALTRTSTTDLVLDGHGFTITQSCEDRVINTAGSGQLTLRNVTITSGHPTSGSGGGVNSEQGPLVLEGVTVRGNSAPAGGGGVSGFLIQIERSTITGNDGGSGGGGGVNGQNVIVEASTIANNQAEVGGGLASGFAALTNSTVTRNTASQLGGGVFLGAGELVLVYTDVVGNTAPTGANIDLFFGSASFSTFASVIARPSGGGNCVVSNVTSNGYNFSDDATCQLDQATDRENAGDPGLGPLADNGGPTPTLLPAATSPLLDAIPVADCQDDGASGVTTDQRGLPRPAAGACDIGSVEVQPPPPPPPPPPAPALPLTPTFTG